jgi:hypothetical protein
MFTLSGATAATFVVANAVQSAFDYNPKWLALAIAEALALGGAYFSGSRGIDYLLAIVNGALIYCTAVGITHISASVAKPQGPIGVSAGRATGAHARRGFWAPWF